MDDNKCDKNMLTQKVVIIGAPGVGTTDLVNEFGMVEGAEKPFENTMVRKEYESNESKIRLRLDVWDTPPIQMWTAYRENEDRNDFIEREYKKLDQTESNIDIHNRMKLDKIFEKQTTTQQFIEKYLNSGKCGEANIAVLCYNDEQSLEYLSLYGVKVLEMLDKVNRLVICLGLSPDKKIGE